MLSVLYIFQGIALLDRTSRPETICLLRVEDLPEDTVERFNHLFTLREKWTEEDITPYIQLVLSIQIIKGFNIRNTKSLWVNRVPFFAYYNV